MRNESITIRQDNVTGWISSRPDRITLPYQVTDDILEHAFMTIVENTPYHGDENDMNAAAAFDAECLKELDRSTVTALLRILPYKHSPIVGITLTVTTADGKHLERHIIGNAERSTIEAILDRFFSMGGAGLTPAFLSHWNGTYTEYQNHNPIKGNSSDKNSTTPGIPYQKVWGDS